jgi:hypothetical protein
MATQGALKKVTVSMMNAIHDLPLLVVNAGVKMRRRAGVKMHR